MAGIPASCTRCGAVFVSRMFNVRPGASVHLSGVRTNCKFCGGYAVFADGLYEMADEVLTFVRSPAMTPDKLARIAAATQSAVIQNQPSAEVSSALDSIDPKLGALFRAATAKHKGLTFLLVLAVAVQAANGMISLANGALDLYDRLSGRHPATVVSQDSSKK